MLFNNIEHSLFLNIANHINTHTHTHTHTYIYIYIYIYIYDRAWYMSYAFNIKILVNITQHFVHGHYNERVTWTRLKSRPMDLGRLAVSDSFPNTFINHASYMPENPVYKRYSWIVRRFPWSYPKKGRERAREKINLRCKYRKLSPIQVMLSPNENKIKQ